MKRYLLAAIGAALLAAAPAAQEAPSGGFVSKIGRAHV